MEKAGKRDHGTRLLTLALTVLLLCMVLVGCGEKPLTLDEQLELGARYLNDLDYENAVIAFTIAIELDGQNPRARAGLCAAYLAQGDEEQTTQAWAAALDAGIPESDLLAELERMAGILADAGDESVQKTIEDKKTPAELPKDADYSAYEGREIQLTIMSTEIKADMAVNFDGYGRLQLNAMRDDNYNDIQPQQQALIDQNGNFLFPYGICYGGYTYSDGIVTLNGGFHEYEIEGVPDFGYYHPDGTPAFRLNAINSIEECVNGNASQIHGNSHGDSLSVVSSYMACGSFHDGVAFVRRGGYVYGASTFYTESFLADKSGNIILMLPECFDLQTLHGGGFDFEGSQGSVSAVVVGLSGNLGWASEGLIPFGCKVQLGNSIFNEVDTSGVTWETTALWGYMDYSGNIVIPQQYFDTIPFSEGLAAVKNENGLWGFIDKTGNAVIPMEYESVYSFRDGLAAVSKGGKTGYINASNELVIPMEYEDGFEAGGGVCPVAQNGRYGLIDYSGQQVLPFEYDDISVCADGVVYAIKDQTVYIITVKV